MILYHGTSQENKKKILKEGFVKSYGEYGECLYLAKSKELAWDYGDELIEVFVDNKYIKNISKNSIIDRLDVENLSIKNNCPAICVFYPDVKSDKDFTEVCVFDLNIVKIIK